MAKQFFLVYQLLLVLLSPYSFASSHPHTASPTTESNQCINCHQAETKAWQKSHHFMAMQQTETEYVLGDFDNSRFEDDSGWTRFYKQGKDYFIETGKIGSAGKVYPVDYVFGYYPLQQILVNIGKGHLQAYTVAWDSRPLQDGGQRWYNLYDDSHDPNSPFYWKGQFNNWNSRCAQCHSTGLQRGYNVEKNGYNTHWKTINVSCESCHGNADQHIQLMQQAQQADNAGFAKPVQRKLNWTFEEGNPTAVMLADETTLATHGQLDNCAACHSRRISLIDGEQQGDFDQHFLPRLAIPDLYHEDGQILDEVYVYGSFTQSKMAAAGVSCSNCHDPHSGKVLTTDNAICTQCHLPTEFDTPQHTLHQPESDGALCIDCHMPDLTYMGVDDRRDHAFRIPNPWVADALNSKDVCLDCHQDKDSKWSQTQLANKKSAIFSDYSDIGPAILLNHQQPIQGQANIRKLVRDNNQPEMRRAVLITHLDIEQQETLETLYSLSNDASYLVRLGVIEALQTAPFSIQVQIGFGLLYDDSKNVRIKAIQLLAPALQESIPDDARAPLVKGLKEAIDTYQAQQDLLSAQLALADLAYKVGNTKQAIIHYQNAIQIQPNFLPAKVNLASIYRENGSTQKSKQLLTQVLSVEPNQGMALFNLGLVNILEKNINEAVIHLQKASLIEPDNLRYGLTYLLALERKGEKITALSELARLKKLTPNDPTLKQLEQRLNQSQ